MVVDGKKIKEAGTKIDPRTAKVFVKKKLIVSDPTAKKVYYMLNKPRNVLTTLNDPEGRPTIMEFFKKEKRRIFPAGRLDWDSEGLLIVTNDGELVQEISHPKSKITKTYIVKLDGTPTDNHLKKLLNGVTIEKGGKVKAISVEKARYGSSKKYDWVKIVINEGKNRQIRKMFAKIGFDVKKLRRVAIGKLYIGSVKPGTYKELKAKDLIQIFL